MLGEILIPVELQRQLDAQARQPMPETHVQLIPPCSPFSPGEYRDIPMATHMSDADRLRAILDAQQQIDMEGVLIGGTR